MWYVYIIEAKNGELYTGITTDVKRRVKQHQVGRGSRFMKIFGLKKLLYQEKASTRSQALKREAQIKSWPRKKKLALVEGKIKMPKVKTSTSQGQRKNPARRPIVIIGLGEIGGVFARGFLKKGCPVYPVTRETNPADIAKVVPDPGAVVVAVGEKDFDPLLKKLPKSWYRRLILVQNELLPRDWKAHGIINPTVISVWFEKKHPLDYKILIPSPVYGPQSGVVASALSSLNIPCRILRNEGELLFELVVKNLYILTINIAGLKTGGSVGELWERQESFARDVAGDILDVQFWLIKRQLNREALIEAMLRAFDADPQHKCMGRMALERLKRAIARADEAGLKVKTLRELHPQKSRFFTL